MLKRATALVCAMMTAALAAPAAMPQDKYEAVVQKQIIEAGRRLINVADNAEALEYYDGRIDDGEDIQVNLPTYSGRTYVLVGACDQDCSDVDLIIHDGDGNVVREDLASDDLPVVQFASARGETYHVHVKMHDCSTSVCYYGVAMFELR